MKKRVAFFRAKIFCVIVGYPEVVLSTLFSIVGILMKEYAMIFVSLICVWLCNKLFIIKREGCLQLVNRFNRYELSMCGSFPNANELSIFRVFLKSFFAIFDEDIIQKLKRESIYINTHSKFCRGLLQLLLTDERIFKEEVVKFAECVYIEKKGSVIRISRLKDRKNITLASKYPIWPSKEQLDEFEREYQLEKFYELWIPVALIEQACMNKLREKSEKITKFVEG